MNRALAFPVMALLAAATMPGKAAALSVMDGDNRAPVSITAQPVRVAAADGVVDVQNINGVAGVPVPVSITPPAGAAEGFRFVMVRGLPDPIAMSAGFRVKQSWFIAIKDIEGVQVLSPGQFHGNFTLEFFFFRDSQEPPLATTALNVQVSPGGGDTALSLTQPEQPEKPAGIALTPPKRPRHVAYTPEQEIDLLRRGDQYMRLGDVASARLLYEDLAAHGSAKGTLSMARTYDPIFLKEAWVAAGLQPNVEKAKLWYQRASDMGDTDAQKRLSALGGR